MTDARENLLNHYEEQLHNDYYNGKFLMKRGKELMEFHSNRLDTMSDRDVELEWELISMNEDADLAYR
jgi:hypothetical protein